MGTRRETKAEAFLEADLVADVAQVIAPERVVDLTNADAVELAFEIRRRVVADFRSLESLGGPRCMVRCAVVLSFSIPLILI